MGRLTEADAAEFLAIKALCYQDLDSITLRERSGERLARYLRAASYSFGATDPATALPVHSVSVGLPPEAMHAFFRLVLATPSLDFGPARALAAAAHVFFTPCCECASADDSRT